MRTCTAEGCAAPHRARGLCMRHYRQWRNQVDELPDAHPPAGALTTTDIAHLADVAPRTVTNWPATGRLPPPDGHASGRPWWLPETLPPISELRRRKRRTGT